MSEVHIIATIHVKKEHIEESRNVFKKLVESSRAESGNNQYELLEDIAVAGNFIVVERWASDQALIEHSASSHFQDFVTFIDQKTTKLEICKMQPASL